MSTQLCSMRWATQKVRAHHLCKRKRIRRCLRAGAETFMRTLQTRPPFVSAPHETANGGRHEWGVVCVFLCFCVSVLLCLHCGAGSCRAAEERSGRAAAERHNVARRCDICAAVPAAIARAACRVDHAALHGARCRTGAQRSGECCSRRPVPPPSTAAARCPPPTPCSTPLPLSPEMGLIHRLS